MLATLPVSSPDALVSSDCVRHYLNLFRRHVRKGGAFDVRSSIRARFPAWLRPGVTPPSYTVVTWTRQVPRQTLCTLDPDDSAVLQQMGGRLENLGARAWSLNTQRKLLCVCGGKPVIGVGEPQTNNTRTPASWRWQPWTRELQQAAADRQQQSVISRLCKI